MTTRTPRLVLVGGGHASLLALAAHARHRRSCASVTLISEADTHAYSGMVPGFIAGRYRPSELTLSLRELAAAAGASFVCATARRVDAAARQVVLDDGGVVPYEAAAVAIGSEVAGRELPGVMATAHFVKPMARAESLVAAFDAGVASRRPASLRVVVVGGGSAGIEVALALRARAGGMSGPAPEISMVHAEAVLCGDRGPACAREVTRALRDATVATVLGARVVAAEPGWLWLDGGARLPLDLLVWTTGPAAPDLFRRSGLPTDADGYVLVDERLRVMGVDALFAAGDCVAMSAHRGMPKAGVHAVRQGTVLAHNLEATCRGAAPGSLRRYRPQSAFLALLATADGRAIASRGHVAVTARWAFHLKDRIDRRFLDRLRRIGR